jgi:hypothetical protein
MGVRCVLHVASGLVGCRPKQPKAKTQSTLQDTQTIRNHCRFRVVCGRDVCSVLRVASGLLGCRAKTDQQTTQPMQQHNQHYTTQHPHHTQRLSMHCCMWCVLCVACRLRVAGLSGETPRANNARQQCNQHYTTPKPYKTPVGSVFTAVCVPSCVSPPGCRAVGRKPRSKQHNVTT